MAIFDFLKNSIFTRKVNQALYEYELHSGQVNVMPDNPDAYIEQGYGNATVYSIVSRIDAMRKQAYLKLYKDGKEVTNHDLLKFASKVNAHTSTDDFITANLIYRLILGESFVYKPAPTSGLNKGKAQELHILPANDVEIIEGTYFDPVAGYRIEGNIARTFEPFEVYHSKLFNPNWITERNLHGLSPLRAAAKKVSALNEADTTQLKQLENQSPPYILFKKVSDSELNQPDSRLNDTQVSELEKKIKQKTDKKYRGLPFIAKDELGKLDLGSNIVDMALNELNDRGVIALCSIYGIPPELFGYGQKTYNNMGTARKSAWTDCIMPNLDAIVQIMNECTIYGTPYESENIKWGFDYSDVEELQEGYETQVNWMIKAGWTKNEIRKATGKEPIDDPLMDQPIINMGESFLSDYSVDLLGGEKDYSDYLKVK